MDGTLSRRYEVDITLKSPLHISSGDNRGGYRTVVASEDRPIIPASTIKGKLRDNFTRLVESECMANIEPNKGYNGCKCAVCTLFGGTGYQPARIYIQDFCLNDKDIASSIRTSTSIDRYRRVAKDESLARTQVIEKGTFTGEIEVYFTPDTIKYEKYLLAGLKMIETIGGGKSRGLGFVNVEVKTP